MFFHRMMGNVVAMGSSNGVERSPQLRGPIDRPDDWYLFLQSGRAIRRYLFETL